MSEGLKKEWLKGLKYRTSRQKKTTEDGRTKVTYDPVERALRPEDVLSFAEKETTVVLVTADGQKLTVEKEAEKPAAK
jgi:urease accessory protein UreE